MTKLDSHIGSSFESFLEEEGMAAETYALAIKKVLSWQIQQAMEEKAISKNQMAKAMHTSRSQLDMVLDPEDEKIQLVTLIKATHVLGKELRIELI